MRVNELNEKELALKIPPDASWHTEYADTAWIAIKGLPESMNEGDLAVMFSQFGTPVSIKLVRDKTNGKSRGRCYLNYLDPKSAVLAVDNANGTTILGKHIWVDHYRYVNNSQNEDKLEADKIALTDAKNIYDLLT